MKAAAAALFTLALLAAPARAADAPLVAVAANFAGAAEAIAAAYNAESGQEVRLTTGSTGKLYAQIRAGAPFAVLLSADAATPERLEAEGLAVAGSRFTYAIGQLALWSAAPGRVGEDIAATLADPSVLHIAIANPDLAPYGVAAREVLQSLGLWDELQPKIVMGQNIGQTLSLVDSGAAELGFVAVSALSVAGAAPKGSHFLVPADAHASIRQDAVLLLPGADDAAAEGFLAFLASDPGRAIAAEYGYAGE
ncbi:MAG: molybdate ABC transporter substrate-binding protein [Paracoccaceae bacterium]